MAADQIEVIRFLGSASSYRNVERVERFETHGNWVFLAGSDAWKIKRAVHLPYMDFSTLEKRRVACAREVAINRRHAPDIYVGCLPIARSSDGKLSFGGPGEVVEWAVHMRRFDQAAILSHRAAAGRIDADLAIAIGDVVFQSHSDAHRVRSRSASAQFDQLVRSVTGSLAAAKALDATDVARFAREASAHLAGVAQTLDRRATAGHVRRCHGDLHLGNIVLWQGRPTLFDASNSTTILPPSTRSTTLRSCSWTSIALDNGTQRISFSTAISGDPMTTLP
jgi:aminoglycoside phosphotransferase family enzyme